MNITKNSILICKNYIILLLFFLCISKGNAQRFIKCGNMLHYFNVETERIVCKFDNLNTYSNKEFNFKNTSNLSPNVSVTDSTLRNFIITKSDKLSQFIDVKRYNEHIKTIFLSFLGIVDFGDYTLNLFYLKYISDEINLEQIIGVVKKGDNISSLVILAENIYLVGWYSSTKHSFHLSKNKFRIVGGHYACNTIDEKSKGEFSRRELRSIQQVCSTKFKIKKNGHIRECLF